MNVKTCHECHGKRTVYDEQRGFVISCPVCHTPLRDEDWNDLLLNEVSVRDEDIAKPFCGVIWPEDQI